MGKVKVFRTLYLIVGIIFGVSAFAALGLWISRCIMSNSGKILTIFPVDSLYFITAFVVLPIIAGFSFFLSYLKAHELKAKYVVLPIVVLLVCGVAFCLVSGWYFNMFGSWDYADMSPLQQMGYDAVLNGNS